jgi:iron complex transport system ATP-binding protein
MSVLSINHLCVAKPGSTGQSSPALLLNNIHCELAAGEILVVIGPNGAGKSTLLKAITGDLSYSGSLQIEGVAESRKLQARQIAVLPQLSLLNFPYRVSEVVMLARIPHQTGRAQDQKIVAAALELMDINYLAHRLYTELSGGEKQRVQLARVLAQIWNADDASAGMRLLLLDEPTAALDLGHQQQLMQAIQVFAQSGVAVLMVLHDINLAAQYADKLLGLLASQQVAYGPVKNVITEKIVQQLFDIKATIISHPEHGTPIILRT